MAANMATTTTSNRRINRRICRIQIPCCVKDIEKSRDRVFERLGGEATVANAIGSRSLHGLAFNFRPQDAQSHPLCSFVTPQQDPVIVLKVRKRGKRVVNSEILGAINYGSSINFAKEADCQMLHKTAIQQSVRPEQARDDSTTCHVTQIDPIPLQFLPLESRLRDYVAKKKRKASHDDVESSNKKVAIETTNVVAESADIPITKNSNSSPVPEDAPSEVNMARPKAELDNDDDAAAVRPTLLHCALTFATTIVIHGFILLLQAFEATLDDVESYELPT